MASRKFDSGYRFWSNLKLPYSFGVLNDTNDELTITVDNVDYTIKVPEGNYETTYNGFSSELIDAINQPLEEQNAPVRVKLGGIHDDAPRVVFVFESTDLTKHGEDIIINGLSGSFTADTVSTQPFATEEPVLNPEYSAEDDVEETPPSEESEPNDEEPPSEEDGESDGDETPSEQDGDETPEEEPNDEEFKQYSLNDFESSIGVVESE